MSFLGESRRALRIGGIVGGGMPECARSRLPLQYFGTNFLLLRPSPLLSPVPSVAGAEVTLSSAVSIPFSSIQLTLYDLVLVQPSPSASSAPLR
jgi:hypothetical protein